MSLLNSLLGERLTGAGLAAYPGLLLGVGNHFRNIGRIESELAHEVCLFIDHNVRAGAKEKSLKEHLVPDLRGPLGGQVSYASLCDNLTAERVAVAEPKARDLCTSVRMRLARHTGISACKPPSAGAAKRLQASYGAAIEIFGPCLSVEEAIFVAEQAALAPVSERCVVRAVVFCCDVLCAAAVCSVLCSVWSPTNIH